MGDKPEFSASAIGTVSSAFAKARIAYCSIPGVFRQRKSALPYLVCRLGNSERACNFCCSTAIDDTVVLDQIPDDTQRVM